MLAFTVALGLFFVPPADRKDPVTPVSAAPNGPHASHSCAAQPRPFGELRHSIMAQPRPVGELGLRWSAPRRDEARPRPDPKQPSANGHLQGSLSRTVRARACPGRCAPDSQAPCCRSGGCGGDWRHHPGHERGHHRLFHLRHGYARPASARAGQSGAQAMGRRLWNGLAQLPQRAMVLGCPHTSLRSRPPSLPPVALPSPPVRLADSWFMNHRCRRFPSPATRRRRCA